MTPVTPSPPRVRQLRLVVEADDFEAAVRFYRDVLGLREELAVDSEGSARVMILDAGRATLELANPAQKRMIDDLEVGRQVAPALRVAFEVDDTEAATRRLVDAGARLVAEPVETPWRSLNARLDAPAGLQITVFEELDAAAVPSLHEWAGGDGAFRRLMDAFYDRVEQDELLSRYFPGGVGEQHRANVTRWWIEVFGGAPTYSDELGGYDGMLAHHRGLAITPDDRTRFAYLMSLAADDAGLPDDPEFRAAFVGYVEWGTRLALSNSQPDASVVEHAPVPHWGWGVAPPYQPG